MSRLFPDLASVEAFNAKSKKRTLSLTDAPTARSEMTPRAGRPSKYGNKKTIVDGIEFDSKKEATRYQDLALMQKAGQIRYLRRQVPYPVDIYGTAVCSWIADFVYEVRSGPPACPAWQKTTEDTKGHRTDIYRLKKKLVEAFYCIQIRET